MTNNSFVQLVRDYASVAKRKHISLADHINELLKMREASIDASAATKAQKGAQKIALRDIVQREYAPSDPFYAEVPQD